MTEVVAQPNAIVAAIAFIKQYGWYFVFAFIAYLALREYVADRYYEYQDPRRKKDDGVSLA